MYFLGIDFGSRRIGIAVSDGEGKIAFPRGTIKTLSTREAMNALQKIIEKERIDKIIIGIPLSFAGGETSQTADVRKFAALLSDAVQLPIEFQNEILTTKQVERQGIAKAEVDAAAAALILQAYLDSHSS